MAHQIEKFVGILGFVTWGDIGPLTIYRTKRGRMVFFAKAPPLCPASLAQQANQDLWRLAAVNWKRMDADRRARWELASKRASLSITGYNLFVYWSTTNDTTAVQTVERITGLDLLPP